MKPHENWTGPTDIRRRLHALWMDGRILAAQFDQSLFPLRIPLKRPEPAVMASRFDDVRRWAEGLSLGDRDRLGYGYSIEWIEIRHRELGRQKLPRAVVVPSFEDAVQLLERSLDADEFRALADETLRVFPALRSWLARRPLVVLEHAVEWKIVLAVLLWLRDRRQPDVYLRQIDIPGIDTKFIERRLSLLSELLTEVLEDDLGRVPARIVGFERRLGFRSKPRRIRFRILDPTCRIAGLSDLTVPADQFAQLDLPVERVFVTENEINGLAFPEVSNSAVVFGLGYGLERLGDVAWLKERDVFYWGDLDTHGFAMLDRLRARLPTLRSFLMDRETLTVHSSLWGEEQETQRFTGSLACLTADETCVFDDLRLDRLGYRVRLEQERLPFRWIERAIGALLSSSAGSE